MLVASVDYPNRLIFLSAATVGVDVEPIDIYKEMRERRRLNADMDRQFFPLITAFGNDPAGPSNTPRFTNLAAGARIVPFDTDHTLSIRGNALISTEDGLSGAQLFDRSSLTASVDIDYQPPQTEIVTISTGSAVTQQDKDDIEQQIFTRVIEDGESFEQALRLIRAEAAGSIEVSLGVNRVKSKDGTKDRVVALGDDTGRQVTSTDSS